MSRPPRLDIAVINRYCADGSLEQSMTVERRRLEASTFTPACSHIKVWGMLWGSLFF